MLRICLTLPATISSSRRIHALWIVGCVCVSTIFHHIVRLAEYVIVGTEVGENFTG
jgi:hypothetical protein